MGTEFKKWGVKMYQKNLTEQIKVRLSTADLEFLSILADSLGISVSQVVRNLVRSARSSFDFANSEVVHYGDSKTDKFDIV